MSNKIHTIQSSDKKEFDKQVNELLELGCELMDGGYQIINNDDGVVYSQVIVLKGSEVILWGKVYSVEDTTSLDLNWNELTGSIPPEIGNLTNLTYLSLSSIGFTGSIPPEIGNLTNLEYLNFNSNQLTGSIPPEIGNLTNLTYLYLYYNQLTGEIPESICNLVENNCVVYINNNQLCPPYPSCIEDYVGEQDTSDCD